MPRSLLCKIDLAFLTERLKSDERMYKSFSNLKISVEKALGRYYDDVRDIEGSVTSDTDV